jgi:hypothetical protein
MKNKKTANLLHNTMNQNGYWVLSKKLVQGIGLEPAFILSDLISKHQYFSERRMLETDGSFYSTCHQQQNDCNISKHARQEAMKVLEEMNFVQVVKRGWPLKNHFLINEESILEFLSSEAKPNSSDLGQIDCTNSTNKFVQNVQTDRLKSANCSWTNPANCKKDEQYQGGQNSQLTESSLSVDRIQPISWTNPAYQLTESSLSVDRIQPTNYISNNNKRIITKEITTEEKEQRPPEAANPPPPLSVLIVRENSDLKEFARRAKNVLMRKLPKVAANNSHKVEDQVVAFTEVIFGDLPYEWWKYENGKRKSSPGKVSPVAYPWDFNTAEKFDTLVDLASDWLKKPKVFFEKTEWTQESYTNVITENLRECLFNNDSYLPPSEQAEKNRKAKQEIVEDKQKSQEIRQALDNMQKIEQAKKEGLLDPTKWTATSEELADAHKAGMAYFVMKKSAPCVESYVYDFIDDLVAVGKAEMPDSFKHPEWLEGFMIEITNAVGTRTDWTWKNPECKTAVEAVHALVRKYCQDAEG